MKNLRFVRKNFSYFMISLLVLAATSACKNKDTATSGAASSVNKTKISSNTSSNASSKASTSSSASSKSATASASSSAANTKKANVDATPASTKVATADTHAPKAQVAFNKLNGAWKIKSILCGKTNVYPSIKAKQQPISSKNKLSVNQYLVNSHKFEIKGNDGKYVIDIKAFNSDNGKNRMVKCYFENEINANDTEKKFFRLYNRQLFTPVYPACQVFTRVSKPSQRSQCPAIALYENKLYSYAWINGKVNGIELKAANKDQILKSFPVSFKEEINDLTTEQCELLEKNGSHPFLKLQKENNEVCASIANDISFNKITLGMGDGEEYKYRLNGDHGLTITTDNHNLCNKIADDYGIILNKESNAILVLTK